MWYENLICLLRGNYLIHTVVDGGLEPQVRITVPHVSEILIWRLVHVTWWFQKKLISKRETKV